MYLAVINTPKGPAEIEVPIEMQAVAGNKCVPLAPSYFAYDGLIEDFTAPKLQRFAINSGLCLLHRVPILFCRHMHYHSL